jgi:hypothetical protein
MRVEGKENTRSRDMPAELRAHLIVSLLPPAPSARNAQHGSWLLIQRSMITRNVYFIFTYSATD